MSGLPAFHRSTHAFAPDGRAGLLASGLALSGLVAGALVPGTLTAQDLPEPCETGIISEIVVDNQEVFDVGGTESGGLRAFYGFMNMLHVRTTPGFIRSELLFGEGDCFDPFLLSESQRLVRDHRFMGTVNITDEDLPDGTKRVIVQTRDEWSTQVDLGVSYDAGLNLETLEVTEENFLGRGLFLSGEYKARRERRDISMRLLTQRFFGRANANIEYGSSRAGRFLNQYITYPFVGEVGLFAGREYYDRRTRYFRIATDHTEAFTHVLLPVVTERFELAAARRFGGPGKFVMVGGSLLRDAWDFKPTELAIDGNFGETVFATPLQEAEVLSQVQPYGATRLALHLASRRVIFREYRGLDALRGQRDVQLGVDVSGSVGKSIDFIRPAGLPAADDWFFRGRLQSGAPLGESLLMTHFSIESRKESGGWRDVMTEADVYAYARASWLPYQTFFARASFAGAWSTTVPFQLSLGGRDAVRSLAEDRFPGGRLMVFTLEDRIYEGWPHWSVADLGLTLFADMGRTWAGDVPYGTDAEWQTSLGIGLRMGLPAGTSNVMRMDLAFPVGGGGPVFRVTVFERHGLRYGFTEEQFQRSRRFEIGPEYFN